MPTQFRGTKMSNTFKAYVLAAAYEITIEQARTIKSLARFDADELSAEAREKLNKDGLIEEVE